jgi:hypothetical protein
MTPKEKANELVYGFIDLKLIPPSKAKQCALICVDEILNALKGGYEVPSDIEHYQEVKQEIEKL